MKDSNRRKSRGGRVLAWTFAVFVLAQLVAGLILDNVCPLVRFEEGRRELKRYRALCDAGRAPDVVVMGTSRFQLAIDENALTGSLRRAVGDSNLRAFNASVPAGDLETSDFVLKRLFAEKHVPRLLVLEVSPETLSQYTSWVNFEVLRFLRWQDLSEHGSQIYASGNPVTFAKARLIPLVTFRKHVYDAAVEEFDEWRHGPRPADPDSCPELVDWRGKAVVPDAIAPDFPPRARFLNEFFLRGLRDYKVGGTALAALNRILDRCEERRIQVLLLSAPVTSFHREVYSPEILQKYAAFLKQLETTRGIEFVDCESCLPDTLFSDGHHVTAAGGLVFGEKLGREILAPRWRRNATIGQPVSRQNEK